MPLDDPNEYFCEVDADDQVIGKLLRSDAHDGSKRLHRSIAVLVFDSGKSHMLLQQRSMKKDTYPGEWTYAVAGHVDYGEDPAMTATREMAEEMSIVGHSPLFVAKFPLYHPNESEIVSIFEVQVPQDISLVFDRDEVSSCQWVELTRMSDFESQHIINFPTKVVFKKLGYL